MTRIAPEHPAARSLEESFRELGDARARDRRRRAPRGTRRVLVIGLTALLIAAVGAAGRKDFLGDGGTLKPVFHGRAARLKPAPGFQQLTRARAADPDRSRLPWGLRTSKAAAGGTCLTVGRIDGGRIGTVVAGRFTALSAAATGRCGDLAAAHVLTVLTSAGDRADGSGRSVLGGIVDRAVRSLGITSGSGATRPVALATDGSFVVVRRGARSFAGDHLVVDAAAGRRQLPLGP
jgi:hypothetical protein